MSCTPEELSRSIEEIKGVATRIFEKDAELEIQEINDSERTVEERRGKGSNGKCS